MSQTPPLTDGEFTAHDEYLRSLARRLLTGTQAGVAEDAVHDTWLRFLSPPPSLDRPVRPWLARVLRNRSRELWRNAGRRGTPEPWTEQASAPSADESVARREVGEALHASVQSLREPYRSTVELHFQQELAPRQIAARLRVPEATVRSRLRRAVQLLREDLDRRGGSHREDWLRALVVLGHPRRRAGLHAAGLGLAAALVVATGGLLWTRLAEAAPHRASTPVATTGGVLGAPASGLAPPRRDASRTPLAPGSGEAELRVRLRRAVSEDPVAGVTAVASAERLELARGTSDAEGELRLSLPLDEALALFFGATATTESLRVELDADWPARPLLEVELPAVCPVEGIVEWSAGSPAGGTLVQAIRGPFPSFLTGEPPRVLTETWTLPDGSFRLARVPVDAALLALADDGRAFGLSGRPHGDRSEEGPMWDEGMERGPEDYLDPSRPHRIRLAAADALSVEVLAPDGSPVRGADLLLKGSGYTLRRARTDSGGRARLHPLVDHGVHALAVRAPGLGEWAHGSFLFQREQADWIVRLEAERTVEGSVVGPRGEPLPGSVVRATLRESSPSPVGVAPVFDLPHGVPPAREVRTDGAGRFVVSGLGDGEYVLEALRDGVLLARTPCRGGERGVVLGGPSSPPLLRFRGSVRDARDGRRISGALAALERSRGLFDERVSPHVVRLPGPDFAFEVEEPGRWILHVAAAGYAPFSSRPTKFGPGTHLLDAWLDPARDLVVRLEDARGRPVRDGWVRILGRAEAGDRSPSTCYAGTAEPVQQGLARLTDVPSSRVEVEVFAPYSMRPFVFPVPPGEPGEETDLRLVVEADATTPRLALPWAVVDGRTGREPTAEALDPLELLVYDEEGTPVLDVLWIEPTPEQKRRYRGRIRVPTAEGEVLAVREAASPSPWWWFGPGPLFSRDGEPCLPPLLLAPGRFRVRLTANGFEPLERWIEVGGAAAPLRLVMTPAEGG